MLGASGHIAGVVNPPAPGKRNYWIERLARPTTPTTGSRRARVVPGSWWPHWYEWLEPHAGARRAAPAAAGNAAHPPLQPAPGTYVIEAA